ncbi:MAG: T9SS type A sorting domain-containing protein [Bacteroidota bacterium]|nr:T9SS type A sorting domain-containing protein [Bacteroidota bacterium]
MKKIFLFLFLAEMLSVSAGSQSLTLSNSEGVVPNNSTITPHGNSGTDEFIVYAYVTNNAAVPLTVKVKKVELHLTPGTVNTFCWGLCYNPDVYVSLQAIKIDPGKTDSTDFSGHLQPMGISGYDLIRYVFYDEANPSDSVCMNINYAHFPVGIENSGTDTFILDASPNPANTHILVDYRFTCGLTGNIVIRDLTGVVWEKVPLTGNSGKANIYTGDLKDGVYLYSLIEEGIALRTKKFIVRH